MGTGQKRNRLFKVLRAVVVDTKEGEMLADHLFSGQFELTVGMDHTNKPIDAARS